MRQSQALRRLTPDLVTCETRLALSGASAAIAPSPTQIPGDVNGDGAVSFADLQAFARAFGSFRGQANYNPEADSNSNGYVGIPDVNPILKGLAPITPRIPLALSLRLAPGEEVPPPHPANNGGVTFSTTVTVIGRTTPNSIVFTDGPGQAYRFNGMAIPVGPSGFFTETVKLSSTSFFTNDDLLVKDPFGHQLIRDFPILRLKI